MIHACHSLCQALLAFDNGHMKATSYGDWLTRTREERGLTKTALANLSGVDRAYISRLEGGAIVWPGEKVRHRIHTALKTSDEDLAREDLMKRTDPPSGFDPVYVPVETPTPIRAIEETQERYDAIDARYRLRLRADTLTEPQAEAILSLIDTFTGHDR